MKGKTFVISRQKMFFCVSNQKMKKKVPFVYVELIVMEMNALNEF